MSEDTLPLLLKISRLRRGHEQEEAGRAIGVHRNTIGRWERGQIAEEKISLGTVRLLALYCDVPEAEISRRITTQVRLVEPKQEDSPDGKENPQSV